MVSMGLMPPTHRCLCRPERADHRSLDFRPTIGTSVSNAPHPLETSGSISHQRSQGESKRRNFLQMCKFR